MGVAPDSEFRYRVVSFTYWEKQLRKALLLPYAELESVAQRLSLPDHQPNPQVVAQLVFEMGMEEQIVLQGHRECMFATNLLFQERTEIGTATESASGSSSSSRNAQSQ